MAHSPTNDYVRKMIAKNGNPSAKPNWNSNALQIRRAWQSWNNRSSKGITYDQMAKNLIEDMGELTAWEFVKLQPRETDRRTHIEWCAQAESDDKFIMPTPAQWVFACEHTCEDKTTLTFEQCVYYFTA